MESFVQKHNFRASFFLFIIIRSDKCLDVSRRIVRAAYSRGVIVFFFTCKGHAKVNFVSSNGVTCFFNLSLWCRHYL